MNECMGNAPEKQANRAEILAHAFRLPEEIAYKIKTLREALSRVETGPENLTKSAQVDYSSLEAILDDGAGIIIEASLSITRDVREIRRILFAADECEKTAAEEASSIQCSPRTKLDDIKKSYDEFGDSVDLLRRLQNTVLPEQDLPKELMHGVPHSDISTTVHFVLRELPDKITSLHAEACDYIRQITESLLT